MSIWKTMHWQTSYWLLYNWGCCIKKALGSKFCCKSITLRRKSFRSKRILRSSMMQFMLYSYIATITCSTCRTMRYARWTEVYVQKMGCVLSYTKVIKIHTLFKTIPAELIWAWYFVNSTNENQSQFCMAMSEFETLVTLAWISPETSS